MTSKDLAFIQTLPTQAEIMAQWDVSTGKPVVSVICMMFNQRDYIEDALRGIMTQQTTFRFQVILHDDCSTDGCGALIEMLAQHYPEIVVALVRTENQHSLGNKHLPYISQFIEGEYIAFCEGDDYWIDPEKLQIQIQIMRDKPDLYWTFHAGRRYDVPNQRFLEDQAPPGRRQYYQVPELVIRSADIGHTAASVFRTDLLNHFPDWIYDSPVLDVHFKILSGHLSAKAGGGHFIDRQMSVYRIRAKGSWTTRTAQQDLAEMSRRMLYLDKLNEYLNYEYDAEFRLSKGRSTYYAAGRALQNSDGKTARKILFSGPKTTSYGLRYIFILCASFAPKMFNMLRQRTGRA